MAKKFYLVNTSVRLVHFFEHTVIPGETAEINVEDKDVDLYKATAKDEPHFKLLNEKQYAEYKKAKAVLEASDDADDTDDADEGSVTEPTKVDEPATTTAAATAWKQ